MRVIVLGSGVIGVTTAWYLAQEGHEVTVVDRQPGAAMETSFGNAGQISPGYSTPWAAPGIPLKALLWLFQRHAPLALRLDGSWFQLRWLVQMLGQCKPEHYAVNKERMVRLAEYSRDCLKALRTQLGIQYEGRQRGTLQLFRTQAQLDHCAQDTEVLRASGVPFRVVEREHLGDIEPALAAVRHKLVGGLHLPGDETGDCRLFTERLAAAAQQAGVTFLYEHHIVALEQRDGQMAAVHVEHTHGRTRLHADHYVLALGSYSRGLLSPLKFDLPVYPLKGYSLTIPIIDPESSPMSTIMDESYKVAITRFDQRIRVGGMAEIAGFDLRLNPRRRATLEKVVRDLFPRGGDIPAARFWTGLRPMTPDGTPIIGPTTLANLWLNTGHGTLGWTMSCGSAQLLAHLISQRTPDINPHGLGLARYPTARTGGVLPAQRIQTAL